MRLRLFLSGQIDVNILLLFFEKQLLPDYLFGIRVHFQMFYTQSSLQDG